MKNVYLNIVLLLQLIIGHSNYFGLEKSFVSQSVKGMQDSTAIKYLSKSFHQVNVISEDYNDDGFIDRLITYYSGGTSFGGWFSELTNGRTSELLHLDSYSSFSTIKDVILIPEVLNKNENSKFLYAMLDYTVPGIKTSADPSLKWIIHGNLSNKYLSDNTYFNQVFFSNSIWLDEINLPDSYSLIYDNEIIVYQAHNHYQHLNGYNAPADSLLLAAESKDYKILKTSHGLIANNENKYKWIFVTDEELTGAPRKLRWSSIGEVILKDKYLLLTINLTGSGNDFDDNGIRNQNYFLININSGKVGRIKNYELAVKNWDLIINEFNFLK